MKIFYSIVLSILLFNCDSHSQSSSENNDLRKIAGLQGKVKSIKDIAYEAVEKFGEIRTGERKRNFELLGINGPVRPRIDDPLNSISTDFLITFNKSGYKNRIEFYDEEFKLKKKNIYKYKQDSILVEQIIYEKDDIKSHRFYTYNSKGLKTEVYDIISSKKSTYGYEYDQNNNLIKYTRYKSNGEISYMSKKKYDKSNNLVLEMDYNSKGDLWSMNGYKFDKNGNKIEYIIYSIPDKKVKDISKYIYNENNNLIKVNSYYSDGSLSGTTEYRKNSEGNKVEEAYYFNKGYKIPLWRIEFDSLGNQIAYADYYPGGKVKDEWYFEYEFDENSNWIKKIGFSNNVARYIVKREIKYFE